MDNGVFTNNHTSGQYKTFINSYDKICCILHKQWHLKMAKFFITYNGLIQEATYPKYTVIICRIIDNSVDWPHSGAVIHHSIYMAVAGISYGTCHNILSDDLNMSHVTQYSIPYILMQDQCDESMSTCDDLLNSADKVGMFLNQIITGDRT
jgi:hypothetical protein